MWFLEIKKIDDIVFNYSIIFFTQKIFKYFKNLYRLQNKISFILIKLCRTTEIFNYYLISR